MIKEKKVSIFEVVNSHSTNIKFILEPWGEEFPMKPGDIFKITVEYPKSSNWNPKIKFHKNNFIILMCYDKKDHFYILENNENVLRTSDYYL